MTDHDQLKQLEPIMRRIGIWPNDIKCDDKARWWLHVPIGVSDDDWVYLGDSYALAIVRDVVEKWLRDKGGQPVGWDEYHIVNKYSSAGAFDLPAALEHAEKQKEGEG